MKKPKAIVFYASQNREIVRDFIDSYLIHLNIDIFWDQKIDQKDQWDEQIRINFHQSQIVIIFVSTDYLSASKKYVKDEEIPFIIEAFEDQSKILFPIVVGKGCPWLLSPFGMANIPFFENGQTELDINPVNFQQCRADLLKFTNYIKNSIEKDIQSSSGSLDKTSKNSKEVSVNESLWGSFFSNYPPKKVNDDDFRLMAVDSNRGISYGKELLPHFTKHINDSKGKNLIYFISACPTQKPSSIAKRLVYSFQDKHITSFFGKEFTHSLDKNNIQNLKEKEKIEMDVVSLSISSSFDRTWQNFWNAFSGGILREYVSDKHFLENPSTFLDNHKRIALAFRIDENDWVGANVTEQLNEIINKFDKLPKKYRKFIFFFICRFPDLHLHRAVDCECHLESLNSIVSTENSLPDDCHKKHITALEPVSEDDVKKWIYKYFDNSQAQILFKELCNKLPHSIKNDNSKYYDMQNLEEMQYEAFAYLRDNYKKD